MAFFSSAGALPDTLSAVEVNAAPGDRIEATLTLLDGDRVLARETFAETAGPAEPPAPRPR